jgi:hypothetical protein
MPFAAAGTRTNPVTSSERSAAEPSKSTRRSPVVRQDSAVLDVMATDRTRRSRADYERGLPDHHDATAGIGGAAPAQSALTLRAVLATFGLVFCAGAAWFAFSAHLPVIGWVAAITVIALVDLAVVLNRKRRGEPG